MVSDTPLSMRFTSLVSYLPPAVAIAAGTAAVFIPATAYQSGHVQGLGADASLFPMPVHEAPLHFALGLVSVVISFVRQYDSWPKAFVFMAMSGLAVAGAVLLPDAARWLDGRLEPRRVRVRRQLRSRMGPYVLALTERGLLYLGALVCAPLMVLTLSWLVVTVVVAFEGAGHNRAIEELGSSRSNAAIRATWTDAAGVRHEGTQLVCSAATLVCAIHENGTTYTVPVSEIAPAAVLSGRRGVGPAALARR